MTFSARFKGTVRSSPLRIRSRVPSARDILKMLEDRFAKVEGFGAVCAASKLFEPMFYRLRQPNG
jgi:hypothetical protein